MKITNKDRGANVRRNLRRWRKPLFVMVTGWILLSLVVCTGAIIYAHENNLSQGRVQMLGGSCGTIMVVVLVAAWLVVFVMADRERSE